MEPQPPERDEQHDDRCPRCAWQPWETVVWFYVAVVAFVCLVVIFAGTGRP